MITLNNIKLPLRYSDEQLTYAIVKEIGIKKSDITFIKIKRLSIDARKKTDIHYIATVDIKVSAKEQTIIKYCKKAQLASDKEYKFECSKKLNSRPVVIGAGPAGLFCALMLARAGEKPIVIERGENVDNRTKAIEKFQLNGKLNVNSNIQFGEGGAGTFSDGKLNTGINDSRSRFVLKEFVSHGAPEEILISAKPHIGTDLLKDTIKNIRKEILDLGGTFHFNTLFKGFISYDNKIKGVKIQKNSLCETIDTENLVIAIGHSARDTFEMLQSLNVEMEQKAFSIGARIEHLRSDIDECQYGKARHILGAADYKISTHLKDGRGVYTFCMCPGGHVVNASSEEGMLCTNGMSLHARNSINSNSAVLVGITPQDYNNGDVLDGIKLQRMIEKNTYNAIGNYIAPVQRVGDFLETSCNYKSDSVIPSIKPGYEFYDISKIYPKFITDSLKEGLYHLGKKMQPFSNPCAVLTAAETRSSSPVRIIRNDMFQSVSYKGLYPCGEGAGYAGGIMSAAVDGIKCAEAILSREI